MATPTNLANIYSAGLWNVGSYQCSGMPYATGSIDVQSYGAAGVKIEFPYVTSWIQIYNLSNTPVNVAFSQNGLQNNNYFTLRRAYNAVKGGRVNNNTSRLPLKVTEVWLSGSALGNTANAQYVDIVAGLTYIPTGQVTAVSPSGSNWSGSVGVG